MRVYTIMLLAVFAVPACDKPSQQNTETATKTTETKKTETQTAPPLKQAYEEAFLIGTALNRAQIEGTDKRGVALTKTHFNAITAENVMKWQSIHPEPGEYDFEAADRFVDFGEQNDMFIVGHTLVWHNQTPQWVFEDENGEPLSREALIERMRDHIHTVVGRYKGRVDGWDVVNEAVNDDGTPRETPWYNIIGERYVELAFRFAHEADPDAELYYNDYSLENPAKRQGAVHLIKSLQQGGAPITGVGTQGHFGLDYPDLEQFDKTLGQFSGLGLDVMVTELEVDVLPSAMDYQGADITKRAELRDELDPYADGLPDEVQQQLAQRYRDLFEVMLDNREAVTRVTFWGVTDADSWKNNWPVEGRTNYPLLFDRQGQPKPAYFSVVELAQQTL